MEHQLAAVDNVISDKITAVKVNAFLKKLSVMILLP